MAASRTTVLACLLCSPGADAGPASPSLGLLIPSCSTLLIRYASSQTLSRIKGGPWRRGCGLRGLRKCRNPQHRDPPWPAVELQPFLRRSNVVYCPPTVCVSGEGGISAFPRFCISAFLHRPYYIKARAFGPQESFKAAGLGG